MNHAKAINSVTKVDYTYQQTFQITENIDNRTLHVKADILDTVTNYKEAYKEIEIPCNKLLKTTYQFVSDNSNKELPE